MIWPILARYLVAVAAGGALAQSRSAVVVVVSIVAIVALMVRDLVISHGERASLERKHYRDAA